MRIRQAKLGFNSQWENSFLRNVNLIRDSRVMPDKVKEKCLNLVGEVETHSSIHAWEIPWTEEPDRLESTGWQRVGHD